ncbi:MAG: LacI family DNA-binding transcriptional regulator [Pseudomonadota bacterium]
MTRRVGRIRDVARATGLSTATISRVMNGASNVTPETRARVLEACNRLNYLPNPAARALSTAKSKTIAAIIPSIENSIYAKFIAAIELTLAEGGYSLVLAISNGVEAEELEAARKLLGMGAEAFILSGTSHSAELTELFRRRSVPHAYTSVWDPGSPIPTIGYDNEALARAAIAHIAGFGHREIAVFHGPLSESDRTWARRAGAEAAAAEAGLSLTVLETSLDVAGGKAAVARLRASGATATATLCVSDVIALGAYLGFAEAGLRVPEDMSVMGFDNLDWSGELVPPLTTVNLPARKMGREVATQLMAHLETGAPITAMDLPGHIVERRSVMRPAGDSA